MDFLLPDEDSMRRMLQEFDRLNISTRLQAVTSALSRDFAPADADDEPQNSLHMRKICSDDASLSTDETETERAADAPIPSSFDASNARILSPQIQKAFAVAVLYLYFVRILGYNSGYGTEIYDPRRGLGELQPIAFAFGELNGLR